MSGMKNAIIIKTSDKVIMKAIILARMLIIFPWGLTRATQLEVAGTTILERLGTSSVDRDIKE